MKASTSSTTSEDILVDQEKELEDAATKIQASFRGHLARKKHQQEQICQDNCERVENLNLNSTDDLEDVDLCDPELNKAATKIQASFRGHKARKDIKN